MLAILHNFLKLSKRFLHYLQNVTINNVCPFNKFVTYTILSAHGYVLWEYRTINFMEQDFDIWKIRVRKQTEGAREITQR